MPVNPKSAIAFVIWRGVVGGAERMTVALAGEMQRRGVETRLVVIGRVEELRGQLVKEEVSFRELGFSRGALVMRHPKLVAAAVSEDGADVAVVASFGYLGTAIRLGGYRRAIVGVEHGDLLRLGEGPMRQRAARWIGRASAAMTHDAEVAVSSFMERSARQAIHARRLVRISHGVRLPHPAPTPPAPSDDMLTIGYAGRLFPGKGLARLIWAVARLRETARDRRFHLRIAGDGPDKASLEALAARLGLRDEVVFLGWIEDMASFWAQCDLAVAPNDQLEESFCVAIVEAMACSRPAVVTSLGALPELVVPDVTGRIVPAADTHSLAAAIAHYGASPELLASHGRAARIEAELRFDLDRCVSDYLHLVKALRA